MSKKVALVLSGGGAFGFAHLGVLQVLEENNIDVDIITGTSMGSLIGGAYASGVNLETMMQALKKFSRKQLIDLNIFALTSNGLLLGKKIMRFLKPYIGEKLIEDCPKKYCAVACDLYTGKKIVLDKGLVTDAIRASISVPGLFKPVHKNKMCLVDGSVVDNIPVQNARDFGADYVITSDVCTYFKRPTKLKSILDVLIAAMDMLVSGLAASKDDLGDAYIRIEQPKLSATKFSQEEIEYSIKCGRKFATAKIEEIKNALK